MQQISSIALSFSIFLFSIIISNFLLFYYFNINNPRFHFYLSSIPFCFFNLFVEWNCKISYTCMFIFFYFLSSFCNFDILKLSFYWILYNLSSLMANLKAKRKIFTDLFGLSHTASSRNGPLGLWMKEFFLLWFNLRQVIMHIYIYIYI